MSKTLAEHDCLKRLEALGHLGFGVYVCTQAVGTLYHSSFLDSTQPSQQPINLCKLKLCCMQDLLLAILVEQEPIKLAPSSSQVPALLAKTKQNIFDVRAQQQASHRYQQRFQQQRPGSGTTASRDTAMEASLRRDSQVSAPGQPSLLPTASGVNLTGDVPQDNAPQQGVYVLSMPGPRWGCN